MMPQKSSFGWNKPQRWHPKYWGIQMNRLLHNTYWTNYDAARKRDARDELCRRVNRCGWTDGHVVDSHRLWKCEAASSALLGCRKSLKSRTGGVEESAILGLALISNVRTCTFVAQTGCLILLRMIGSDLTAESVACHHQILPIGRAARQGAVPWGGSEGSSMENTSGFDIYQAI